MNACKKINFLSKNILFLVVAVLGFSSDAFADAKQDIIDARQETQIWTTYALSPYLRASDLKVAVHSGKATLSGSVDEDVNKELAKQIALGVEGIKDVDNQIVVKSDYKPSAKHGYGEAVDDVSINAAVRSRLIWSKYSYIATKVETKDGRVTLTGAVDSVEAKTNAGNLAASTRGVRSVTNQIVVENKNPAGNSLKNTAQDAGQKVEDVWITTKVKSNFLYSSNVSGTDIEVDTKDGVVTLKGKLNSGDERALAVELAQNVRGVKSVDAKGLTVN